MIKRSEKKAGVKKGNLRVLIPYFLVVLLALGLVLFVERNFSLPDISLSSREPVSFDEDWTEEIKGDGRILSMTKFLPEALERDKVLYFETDHSVIRAFLKDKLIYEYDTTKQALFGSVFGTLWNRIEIPKEAAGCEIRIELEGPFGRAPSSSVEMMLGDEGALIQKLLLRNLDSLIFCFVILGLGIFSLAAAFVLKFNKLELNYRSFFYLGLFTLFSVVWIGTDGRLLQIFWGNQAAIYLLSFSTFMLLPVPMLLYIRELCSQGKRLLNALSLAFVVTTAISLLLYALNVTELFQTNIAIHILILISIVAIIKLCLIEKKKNGNVGISTILWGLGIFSAMSVASIVFFYVGDRQDNSFLFRIGLLAFLLFLGWGTVEKSMDMIQESLEAETYKRLALIDPLTRLPNRRAFEMEMERLDGSLERRKRVSMVVFDLNGLKKVNDGKGHAEGDRLITEFAGCLAQSFQKGGVAFRIGGDEFVVLLRERPENGLEERMLDLKKDARRFGRERNLDIQFAWGGVSAGEIGTEGMSMSQLFDVADSRMYANKRQPGRERPDEDKIE